MAKSSNGSSSSSSSSSEDEKQEEAAAGSEAQPPAAEPQAQPPAPRPELLDEVENAHARQQVYLVPLSGLLSELAERVDGAVADLQEPGDLNHEPVSFGCVVIVTRLQSVRASCVPSHQSRRPSKRQLWS